MKPPKLVALDFDDLVRLDFTYPENWSIWPDLTIIARTTRPC